MKVIGLRGDAVFVKAGSYASRPKSSGPVRIWRKSMARIAPSTIGTSYCLPVRLSTTVRLSLAMAHLRAVICLGDAEVQGECRTGRAEIRGVPREGDGLRRLAWGGDVSACGVRGGAGCATRAGRQNR